MIIEEQMESCPYLYWWCVNLFPPFQLFWLFYYLIDHVSTAMLTRETNDSFLYSLMCWSFFLAKMSSEKGQYNFESIKITCFDAPTVCNSKDFKVYYYIRQRKGRPFGDQLEKCLEQAINYQNNNFETFVFFQLTYWLFSCNCCSLNDVNAQ